MSEEKFLEVKNLSVQYQTDDDIVHAINNVNFSVGKGQTVGLVGETGAGKTTLALSIMGLLPKGIGQVTSGSVEYKGVNLLELKAKQLLNYRGEHISMIFQDPMTSLNPVIPVGKQVAEILELHNNNNLSRKEIEARVDEMFELVGIPAYRKLEYPHQFSGGMKQRVVIAIALACEPDLLIADEPTTALDVTIQAQVLAMMDDLKEKLGTSVIMITHDLGVVAETCDIVAVMYAGEIIEHGTVEEIFEGKHHHPYTVGLFGAVPDMDTESERLHPIDGLMADPVNLPTGCKFHLRCPHCMDICREQLPNDNMVDGHMIKCHLFDREDSI